MSYRVQVFDMAYQRWTAPYYRRVEDMAGVWWLASIGVGVRVEPCHA